MRLYLRIIRLPQPLDFEELRNYLTSSPEVRSVDSITKHTRGGASVHLRVEKDSIETICDYLCSDGYRAVI